MMKPKLKAVETVNKPFTKGGKPGPGRPKGSRTYDIRRDLLMNAAERNIHIAIMSGDVFASGIALLVNALQPKGTD